MLEYVSVLETKEKVLEKMLVSGETAPLRSSSACQANFQLDSLSNQTRHMSLSHSVSTPLFPVVSMDGASDYKLRAYSDAGPPAGTSSTSGTAVPYFAMQNASLDSSPSFCLALSILLEHNQTSATVDRRRTERRSNLSTSTSTPRGSLSISVNSADMDLDAPTSSNASSKVVTREGSMDDMRAKLGTREGSLDGMRSKPVTREGSLDGMRSKPVTREGSMEDVRSPKKVQFTSKPVCEPTRSASKLQTGAAPKGALRSTSSIESGSPMPVPPSPTQSWREMGSYYGIY